MDSNEDGGGFITEAMAAFHRSHCPAGRYFSIILFSDSSSEGLLSFNSKFYKNITVAIWKMGSRRKSYRFAMLSPGEGKVPTEN